MIIVKIESYTGINTPTKEDIKNCFDHCSVDEVDISDYQVLQLQVEVEKLRNIIDCLKEQL